MPLSAPATAFARVTQLASDVRVHRAFQWLHLHEAQIMQWQAALVAVPAPPFGERPRAGWLAERFRELGLDEVFLDGIGNATAAYKAEHPTERTVLLSAHIDTVFPADTVIEPAIRGARLEAPGACDNGAGVACLLAVAAALKYAGMRAPANLIFCGNVGEEGDGDLRGMRHVYEHAEFRHSIAAHVVLDGAGHEVAVTEALGSQRYLVTVRGPGGHSWTDAGRANPIVALSHAITRLSRVSLPDKPRTTLNVGTIEGGTAINAIPESAAARFDFRSTDPEQLIRLEVELHRAVEDAVMEENAAVARGQMRAQALEFAVEKTGHRPAGALAHDSQLMETLHAVDRHLNIRSEFRTGSTDANIPLSLGVPAVCVGGGGTGGGIHTRSEWYDGSGRELGLRRVLLLLLALAAD
jgi:tripeptide aminopeptidase